MLDNIKSQMRKGLLEYCILLILKDRAAYATDILNKLKEVQLIVVEGTLYPILSRLKKAELLTYYWEESTQGPPRKYFKMTDKGEQMLTGLEQEWKSMVTIIESLRETTNNQNIQMT